MNDNNGGAGRAVLQHRKTRNWKAKLKAKGDHERQRETTRDHEIIRETTGDHGISREATGDHGIPREATERLHN